MADKDKGDKDKKKYRFSLRSKPKKHEPAETETKFGQSDKQAITEQPRKESGPTSPHSSSASPGVSSPLDTRQFQSSDRSQSGSGSYQPVPQSSQATPPSDSGKVKKKAKEEEKHRAKELEQAKARKTKLEKDRLKAQQKLKGGKGKSKGVPEKLPGDQTPETMSPISPPGHVISGAARLFPHPSDDTSGDVVGKTGGEKVVCCAEARTEMYYFLVRPFMLQLLLALFVCIQHEWLGHRFMYYSYTQGEGQKWVIRETFYLCLSMYCKLA